MCAMELGSEASLNRQVFINDLVKESPSLFRLVEELRILVEEFSRSEHRSYNPLVESIRQLLSESFSNQQVTLPLSVCTTNSNEYARQCLFVDDAIELSIVTMTWGPGQGTPIHDHDGVWCVEGVAEGNIQVDQYELLSREGQRYQFRKVFSQSAGVGNAGSLIPPNEHHSITNISNRKAVTLHVYGGELKKCRKFEPSHQAGWYIAKTCELSYR